MLIGEVITVGAGRVPNVTLTLPASPPQSSFATAPAFGNLTFTNPVAVVAPPGETNRLFVVEQRGYIAVITNLAAPTRSQFLNLSAQVAGGVPTDERGLLGLAFHPNYANNGYFYVYYSSPSLVTTNVNGTVNSGPHQCLSRFTVSGGNPNVADSASQLRLLALYDEADNHNGGCLQFGADGYLYVSTGDEGNQNDSLNNSQTITKDLWSGLLRLDVNSSPGNLLPAPHASQRFTGWNGVVNFRVPTNNPFVGATQFNGAAIDTNALRTEFWAVGLRNPWRFSFDQLTGALYLGDVGGSEWEEVNVIVSGGNYGWAYREGNASGPKSGSAPPGFTGRPPIVAYAHGNATNQGSSVTGGVVYRGTRFPSLNGKYIFADYVSGHLWAAQPNGTNAVPFPRLLTDAGISAFGLDPRNGDVLLCDQSDDTIKRLVSVTNLTGPSTLAATGAFTNLVTLTPQPGIVPYELNVPFWSDHAHKTRWFSVPNTNLFLTFSAEDNWQFPTGTVWIKHFELVTNTLSQATRRLETRFIVRYTNGVYGLTYRWTTPPTNALLVAEEGFDEAIPIDENGVVRIQVWHFPGRGECLSCHTGAGGGALGFDTLQLNRSVASGPANVNQLQQLSDYGYLAVPISGIHALRSLAHPTNEQASLEWRARSYLDANCSFCHQPASTVGSWDGRLSTPTRLANLIEGIPLNDGGNSSNRIIARGLTNFSLIHARLNTRGLGAMPPLASSLVDTNGVALLARWIASLTNYQTYAEWQVAHFGSTNAPGSGEFDDFDADGARNYQEYLTATDPLSSASAWGLAISGSNNAAVVSSLQPANRAVELQWSPNLQSASNWSPIMESFNQPFYPSSNRLLQFSTNSPISLFFRARISEP